MMRSMQYVFIEASWYEALDLDVLKFNVHANVNIKSGRITFGAMTSSAASPSAKFAVRAAAPATPPMLWVTAWSFWFLGCSSLFWLGGGTPCNRRRLAGRPQRLDNHVVFWARHSGRARGAAIGASGHGAALRAERAHHLVRAPSLPLGRG